MVSSKKIPKKYALPKWFWLSWIAVALVIIGSIGAFSFWRSGWPGYYSALSACGGKPPVEARTFITKTYLTPADDKYKIPGNQLGYAEYFCTEAEALEAGYDHEENSKQFIR